MSKYGMEWLDEHQFGEWNEYVHQHPFGTVFHKADWLSRVGRNLTVLVLRERGGPILAGVALVCTRKFGVEGFHIPPFTPHFGPLMSSVEGNRRGSDARVYLDRLQAILRELSPSPVYDFSVPGDGVNLLPYIWGGFRQSVRYTFEISGSVEGYLREIGQTKRRQIRHAERAVNNGSLSCSTTNDLEVILPLLRDTVSRRKFRMDIDLCRRVFRESDGDLDWEVISVCDSDGGTLAAALMVYDRGRGYFMLNATANSALELKSYPNLLVTHRCVQACLSRGMVFDFHGSTIEGVAIHHIELGAREVVRYRVQKTRAPILYALQVMSAFRAARRPIQGR